MTRRVCVCGVLIALLTASCAGPVYLNSPSIQAASATAADQLPDEAAALRPFDDQAVGLKDFSIRENSAVARYWAAARDDLLGHLVAMDSAGRRKAMEKAVTRRLSELGLSTDGPGSADRLWAERRSATDEIAVAEDFAEIQRNQVSDPALKKQGLDCETVLKNPTAGGADPLNAYNQLVAACRQASDQTRIIAQIDAQVALRHGEVGAEFESLTAANAQLEVKPSPADAALQKQIDDAVAASTAGSADLAARLERFRETIEEALQDASEASRAATLTDVSDTIDAAILGESCAAKPAADRAADAKCSKMDATSLSGKVEASWGLAEALAELADANAKSRIAAQWLIAARAIVAAQKADAELAVERAKDEAATHLQRMLALEREGNYLARTYRSLHGPRGDCHSPPEQGDRNGNLHCALSSYLDSWNEGRIPAAVLAYRPIQLQRLYAVRSARVVAQKQHALAEAAAIELKNYGAGGLKPDAIAQALFDLAVIAK